VRNNFPEYPVRFFLLALLLTCSSRAFADTLWAVDDTSGVKHLWQIDTTTGAATQVVTLATTNFVGDITVLNGTIYGGADNPGAGFSTIDPVTGVLTVTYPRTYRMNPAFFSIPATFTVVLRTLSI
jgi:hypothetical protein